MDEKKLLKRIKDYENLLALQPKVEERYLLQLLGSGSQSFDYRRFKLNRFMSKNLSIKIIPHFGNCYFNQELSKVKYVVASHPYGFDEIFPKLPKDCKIFYDKTDYWDNRLTTSNDINLIKRANLITCSSEFIYEHLPSKKTLLVENGCDFSLFPNKNIRKHKRPSAIYVGYPLNKLDVNNIIKLAKENPGIDFYIFCQDYDKDNKIHIEEYELDKFGNIFWHSPLPYEEIINEIAKCHVGLILLKDDTDWTKGMFSLKVWDYLKCGIPVYYSNSINYQKYDGKYCFNENKYDIKDVINIKLDENELNELLEQERWENKFNIILKYYGLI